MNELPKNWYVKVTIKNKLIISKWYGSPLEPGKIAGMVFWNNGKIEKGCNPENITIDKGRNGYDFGNEISFETFERLVLGINKETIYELW
jgi:hypothetical protein